MKTVVFELLALRWRSVACQWWRLWEAQGGLWRGLRGLPQSRVALVAAEAAATAARVADFFHALAAVYPLGNMGRAHS